ncbi:MAG TPA: MCP four helix bundle domain-containing protein [Solirubrobacterales bacterium]|nr:MCP four helix bundle domain-containing protein [Solirubrobacterales bacterium]
MTIRAKLYAAIVLTVLGPIATTAVALHGMSQLGDRFDEVQEQAEHESIARELKFRVTDLNGWQTAYGYAGGDVATRDEMRRRYVRAESELADELQVASSTLDDPREQELLARLEGVFERFKRLDAVAWRALREGDAERTRQIFLGPEIRNFEQMAAIADELATYEDERAAATDAEFDDARDDARRRLIAVALGAGIVIVLLLFTANDIARMALEGERSVRGRPSRDTRSGGDE